MKRAAVVRREGKSTAKWQRLLKKEGFIPDQKNPDIAFSIGGDGTFLFAERFYPGIPKVLIRESSICKNCNNLPLNEVFKRIRSGDYKIKEFRRLELRIKNKILKASNEINIRNKSLIEAIRFRIDKFNKEFVGDGVIISTSFGSGGYFHSITKKRFDSGFGMAWNNSTENIKPVFLDNLDITIEITRGKALVAVDNNPKILELKIGDKIKVSSGREIAKIVKF